jgi:3'-phosphoadenosine 5'-phosphosulfate (PAPS) 3'-phosphatase
VKQNLGTNGDTNRARPKLWPSPDAELIGMGSAGAMAMAVVRGEADIYLHTGGQYE